jgi:hypothetical protein
MARGVREAGRNEYRRRRAAREGKRVEVMVDGDGKGLTFDHEVSDGSVHGGIRGGRRARSERVTHLRRPSEDMIGQRMVTRT